MSKPKVTVGVVLFGTKYLKESLPSLINQDYPNIEFIFRDQEEKKYSAYKLIKKELPEVAKKVTLTKGENVFHSGGHNAIINKMKGDYYICASNDMLYPKDMVSKMVKAMEENSSFSFGTCKSMRWGGDTIDSFGIEKTPYHHFYEIGHGQKDTGQFDNLKEVWGVSGALGIYKKEALDSIKDNGHYFDPRIHYKNDVDLSYRLRQAGHKALLIQTTSVQHDRQLARDTKKTRWMRESSFKGEQILLKKIYANGLPLHEKILTHIYHFLKKTYLKHIKKVTPG